MKILFFAPYYLPHNYGITVCIDEFAKFISPRVEKITIITPHIFKDSEEKELKYGNVEIVRFPAFYLVYNYPFPKLWNIKTWKILIEFIKNRKDYDLIVTTIRFFFLSFLGIMYAKIFRIKSMHIEQVGNFTILSNKVVTFLAKCYDYTLGNIIFHVSDINIAPSTDTRNFINKFDKRRVPIIFNSLNWEEIEKIKPAYEIKNKYKDKIIICYPGRLCKWKGIEKSIEVIKSLPENIKDKIVFLLIGDGEDFSSIKKQIADEKTIEMTGELPRKKVLEILKVVDIYLHSVMHGGALSNSLLEAMYCKCAVIATPNEGARDVINPSNGRLIFSNNQMKKALIELIEDKEKREKLGNLASRTIVDDFNWEDSIGKYWEIIKKL